MPNAGFLPASSILVSTEASLKEERGAETADGVGRGRAGLGPSHHRSIAQRQTHGASLPSAPPASTFKQAEKPKPSQRKQLWYLLSSPSGLIQGAACLRRRKDVAKPHSGSLWVSSLRDSEGSFLPEPTSIVVTAPKCPPAVHFSGGHRGSHLSE